MGRKRGKAGDKKFATYIYKVLKQVHPDTGISAKAMAIMDSLVKDVRNRLFQEAINLVEIQEKATCTSREIQTAVRLVLPGELAKYAVSEGTKAVTKFVSRDNWQKEGAEAEEKGKATRTSLASKTGLQFPVALVKTWMKKKAKQRINKGAPVYLTAVLQYLCAEVLELGGNAARDNKLTRITPRHLFLAISNDEELSSLCKHAIIPGAGVLPNIHNALIPRKGGPLAFSFPGPENNNNNPPPTNDL